MMVTVASQLLFSISDDAFSNNAPMGGHLPNEEVNQIQPLTGLQVFEQNNIQDLGLGINNIMRAYPEDEELDQPASPVNNILHANVNIEEPQIAAVPMVDVATVVSDVAVQPIAAPESSCCSKS